MAWLWTMIAATLAFAGPAPADDFERGKTAFSRAEYARAIEILKPLLYPEIRLDSEGEVLQAHRMLGVAHLFENHPDDATREFRKLLELRPDYRFDPITEPPRVVEFFNGVLKEEANEIAALDAKRKRRDAELARQRQRDADRLCAERTQIVQFQKHSYAINFLPFGAGQFQNGQRRKGWTFLGVESALGAVSVAAFSTNFALFGFKPQRRCLDPETPGTTGVARPCMNIDHSQESLSRELFGVQLVSGGLFLAVAAWGIIDAIRSFRPQVPIVPGDAEPPRAGAGTPSAKTGLRLRPAPYPYPLAGGSGLGLEWRF
jgi:hypothetical protein